MSLVGRKSATVMDAEEINRVFPLVTIIEEPRNGDRIVALQRTIDNGRISGHLPLTEGGDFKTRLDDTRRDYIEENKKPGRQTR